MAVFVSLSPLATRRPGYAELHIESWSGDAADVELSIRRNSSPAHLDAQGKWGGEQQWLRFGNGQVREGRLAIEIGPAIVDAMLEARRNSSFLVEVRKPDGVARYPVKPIPHDVTPSTSAGEAPAQAATVNVASANPAQPVVPDLPQEPVEKPEPIRPVEPHTPTKPQSRPMGAIIGGLLALLVAAGAAAWFFLKQGDVPEPAPKVEAPAPAPAAAVCSKESLATASEMAFVQDCVRDVKDPAAMLAVIQAARDSGKCSIAQRLYANRAQAGDAQIALAYAQEYDPASYKENACFKADAATAAYWYQAVLEKDKDNAQAQARLKELPK